MNYKCSYCSKREAVYACSSCEKAFYCGEKCQQKDWKENNHSQICARLTDETSNKTSDETRIPRGRISRSMYLTDDLYEKDGRTYRVRIYLQKIPNKPYGEKTYDYKFIPNDVVIAYIKISEKEYENVEKLSRLRPEQGYSPDPRYFRKMEEYRGGLQRFLENEGFEHRIWD